VRNNFISSVLMIGVNVYCHSVCCVRLFFRRHSAPAFGFLTTWSLDWMVSRRSVN
jgi:hypothetical protein